MDKAVIDAGIARGDYQSIKIRLRELGYSALLVKGPHTRITFQCKDKHQWQATPMEAISQDGGCPDCELVRHINEDPAPVVSFEEFKKGVDAQQRFLKQVLERTKRKLVTSRGRSPSGRYGI